MASSESYHHGELAAQKRAGVVREAAHVAALLGAEIPRVARTFLAAQPMVVVGAAGRDGAVWATMLTGEPGFLAVTGTSSITVAATPAAGDPLHDVLAGPARVGMIGIEPGTRRRVRMNGTSRPIPGGLRVDMDQVYANCPKYIQKRLPEYEPATPGIPRRGDRLTADEMDFVAAADTFFVATTDAEGNADASHRGGNPGFLRALSPAHLRWPDYPGNAMFNTFGNLEVNPRAGLLLPDWSTGALLHLTGTAAVDWDAAERAVDFTIERVIRIDGASPLRWTDPEFSRFNP
ncbi:pyridoxamine 5'-phosphate oxidase family protein [Actinoplanes sp. NPDC023714]|uniref:pyridoxamine 5'-phosphate oxidase family protein n=1 Tax=Actinoplanes sp. NPDC023714 TaxID=3154322 RepID=UPI0033E7F91B